MSFSAWAGLCNSIVVRCTSICFGTDLARAWLNSCAGAPQHASLTRAFLGGPLVRVACCSACPRSMSHVCVGLNSWRRCSRSVAPRAPFRLEVAIGYREHSVFPPRLSCWGGGRRRQVEFTPVVRLPWCLLQSQAFFQTQAGRAYALTLESGTERSVRRRLRRVTAWA